MLSLGGPWPLSHFRPGGRGVGSRWPVCARGDTPLNKCHTEHPFQQRWEQMTKSTLTVEDLHSLLAAVHEGSRAGLPGLHQGPLTAVARPLGCNATPPRTQDFRVHPVGQVTPSPKHTQIQFPIGSDWGANIQSVSSVLDPESRSCRKPAWR